MQVNKISDSEVSGAPGVKGVSKVREAPASEVEQAATTAPDITVAQAIPAVPDNPNISSTPTNISSPTITAVPTVQAFRSAPASRKSIGLINAITVLLLCVSVGLQIFSLIYKSPGASEIFSEAQSFVVEIKASTDTDSVAYGSGVVIDSSGVLVTNYHVVTYTRYGEKKLYDSIAARFCDEEEYSALELLAYDEENDIAILRFQCSNCGYTAAKLSGEANAGGDRIYAVGNTSNYGISISEGLVSVPLVNIEYGGIARQAIQCDLTIAEGNSGGALLNADGELVGITSFRIKDSGGNIIYGISYSIPVDKVINLYKTII